MKFIETKCLVCGESYSWSKEDFLQAPSYAEKAAICFCVKCQPKAFTEVPRGRWINIVETYDKKLRGLV